MVFYVDAGNESTANYPGCGDNSLYTWLASRIMADNAKLINVGDVALDSGLASEICYSSPYRVIFGYAMTGALINVNTTALQSTSFIINVEKGIPVKFAFAHSGPYAIKISNLQICGLEVAQ